MQPRDLTRIHTLTDPALHRDRRRVAFTVRVMDLDGDEYRSRIWLHDGDEVRPFTSGPCDTSPRWAPDGTRLAFLRTSSDENDIPQLAVMRSDGGEAAILTDFPLGAGGFAWSPDGSVLCVEGIFWIPELADLDPEERSRRARRITHPQWDRDGDGWLYDRRRHLFLISVDGTSRIRPLTSGDFDATRPRWHPDGDRVAFVSARHPGRHFDSGKQAWEVPVEGGDPRPLVEVGWWLDVSYRGDGCVHVTGHPDPWAWPDIPRVHRLEPDGSLVDLTGHADRPVVSHPTPAEIAWLDDERFLCLMEDRGRVHAVAVDPRGRCEVTVGGDRWVTGASAEGADAVAFVATDPTDPGELFMLRRGGEARLTGLNASFRDEVPLAAPRAFTFSSGGNEVDGWIYLPPGDDPAPLLLNVHGGPATQYGWSFLDEFQVYATAGYGVVATNPRGSSGRGVDWVRAVVGTWHEDMPPDLADLRAAVDAALDLEPRLDADRLGVMGGSYGGFITTRLLADDDRFRSAVVERALLSWLSFAGTSDIGSYFDRMYLEAQLPDAWERLWEASPISRAHRIRTPTLVLHSEADRRCPIEQAEQLFVLLQRQGVPSELLRFPDEGHELSRSGRPSRRLERFEHILRWHASHLT